MWPADWLKEAGDVVTACISAMVLIEVLHVSSSTRTGPTLTPLTPRRFGPDQAAKLIHVFPFDFTVAPKAFAVATRLFLGLFLFGVGVSIVVNVVRLARGL